MKTMIENLINGNIADAKKQAKRYSGLKIEQAMIDYGWSPKKATLGAKLLKGWDVFQEFCDEKE